MRIASITVESKTVLAPLAGISDSSFRRLARSFGAGLVFTEMVSVEGLLRRNRSSLRLLRFTEEERPIGAQLFGSRPQSAEVAVKIAESFNPDFIDLNAGCPVRKVVKKEGGAALLKDLKLLEAILKRLVNATDIPVTLKLRSGWDEDSVVIVEASQMAESLGCVAITVHPRTQRQGFSGKADWELIARVKEAVKIPVIGNGDVMTPLDAKSMLERTGCDLVMVGRASIGNPWVFSRINHYLKTGQLLPEPTSEERMEVLLKHARLMVEELGEKRAMKKSHSLVGWYTKGLPHAQRLGERAAAVDTYRQLRALLQEYLGTVRLRRWVRNSKVFGLTTDALSPSTTGSAERPEFLGLFSPVPEKEDKVKALLSPGYQKALQSWQECKYLVLEHSPKTYGAVQGLLRSPQSGVTVSRIRSEIEAALAQSPGRGSQVCAALHVWGELKGKAKNGEKLRFLYFLDAFKRGGVSLERLKRLLYGLALKQRSEDLLSSRYFEAIEFPPGEQERITSEAPSSARR